MKAEMVWLRVADIGSLLNPQISPENVEQCGRCSEYCPRVECHMGLAILGAEGEKHRSQFGEGEMKDSDHLNLPTMSWKDIGPSAGLDTQRRLNRVHLPNTIATVFACLLSGESSAGRGRERAASPALLDCGRPQPEGVIIPTRDVTATKDRRAAKRLYQGFSVV
ncbi:hypothetical protein PoB_007661100 [Plakobranchus ocellatus]|uniref:Uncharacterized protein n=1 Tax=Plakobranchus ocellatus TaxID=259542 RepID=A0AAV4E198_9GAST|nr:hypothetical protein PoB_007661100 [Plakobranchus ocellatus]